MWQKLRIAGTVKESITDGPGIRYTLFVQGCPHECRECHNPETWDFEGGKIADTNEIFEEILKNPLVRGVTFSGGEPFCYPEPLIYLAKKLKDKGYEIAIYTGYTWDELTEDRSSENFQLLSLADVIVDGPFLRDLRDISLKFKGSSNQRIINVQKSLKESSVVLEASERWSGE